MEQDIHLVFDVGQAFRRPPLLVSNHNHRSSLVRMSYLRKAGVVRRAHRVWNPDSDIMQDHK